MYVDKTYRTHVVIECMKDAPSLIVGFVLENNKGLPLFDINNFINQGEVVNGKKNDIIEIVYEYTLPRIMNGVYLVGAAVGRVHSLSMKCLPGFMVLWNWKS
ncbi:MAG: Wzt carbohydrate-binding domain-containing protein [Blautia faecis]